MAINIIIRKKNSINIRLNRSISSNYVPLIRKINGYDLTIDRTLNADDIAATASRVWFTPAEKSKALGAVQKFFAEDITERDAITTMNTGDLCVVSNDGDGKRAVYDWSGTAWIKNSDPDWENVVPTWASITDKPTNIVLDNNYVHTDNNYTTTEKQNLANQSNTNTGDETQSTILTKLAASDQIILLNQIFS